MAVLLAVTAAFTLAFAVQASSAQAACEGGKFCVWTGTFYTGEESNFSCSLSTGTSYELRSAQNHCVVNVRIGWVEGSTVNWKACMAPGGLRPEPGRFNTVSPGGC
jgi:hypothetical protein